VPDSAARRIEALRELAQPRRGTLLPNRAHPYLRGVREVIALSDYAPQAWTVRVPRDGFVLSLATSARAAEGVLWMRPRLPGPSS